MNAREVLGSAVSECLVQYGFQRSPKTKRLEWVRVASELTSVVDLQRSRWSECYYVNIGAWIHDLLQDGDPYPRLNVAVHVLARLEAMVDQSSHDASVLRQGIAPVEAGGSLSRDQLAQLIARPLQMFAERTADIDHLLGLLSESRHWQLHRDAVVFLSTLGFTRDIDTPVSAREKDAIARRVAARRAARSGSAPLTR
jgi:Domain of unknown function (DUF4304)